MDERPRMLVKCMEKEAGLPAAEAFRSRGEPLLAGGVSPLTPPESTSARRFFAPPFAGYWGPGLMVVLSMFKCSGGGNKIYENVKRKERTELEWKEDEERKGR